MVAAEQKKTKQKYPREKNKTSCIVVPNAVIKFFKATGLWQTVVFFGLFFQLIGTQDYNSMQM
jgi:hypothetical protein